MFKWDFALLNPTDLKNDQLALIEKKVDSFPCFPRNAVQHETVACLTSEFEMGSGEPSPYGRPRLRNNVLFKKVCIN